MKTAALMRASDTAKARPTAPTKARAPDPKVHREIKRGVSLGLALFAAGVMALLYMRTL